MLDINVKDGSGNPFKARVSKEGAMSVVLHPHPPRAEVIEALPFRQYFTDNGKATGSNNMIVNGSVNSVDFYISAVPDFDIYVKYISAEIGDSGTPALNKFGALTALPNGIEWIWFNQSQGEYQLHEGIKTNKEFIRIGTDSAGFGDGVNAFLADTSGGGTEKSYLPNIDISESYGLPWGLHLRRGTNDKIIFRIKDNLSGLTTFNIVAFGIRLDGF